MTQDPTPVLARRSRLDDESATPAEPGRGPAAPPGPSLVSRIETLAAFARAEVARRADSVPAATLLDALKSEARAVEVFLADPTLPAPPSGLLRSVRDPVVLENAVTFRDRAVHPALYFLPILAAWGTLGVTEYRFQHSGVADDQSFFAWWAGEPFGPWAFSGLLGGVVALLMLGEFVIRGADKRSRRVEGQFRAGVIALAAHAVVVLDQVDRTTRPRDPVVAMERIATSFERGGSTADVMAATSSLSSTLTQLTGGLGAIDAAAQSLRFAAESMPEKVAGWRDDLSDLSGLPEAVRTSTSESRAAAEAFARGAAELVARLPQVGEVLERSQRLSSELVSSEQALAHAVTGLQTANVDVQAEREHQLDELKQVIAALQHVSQDLAVAAVELRRGVVLVDALDSLGGA